MVGSSQLLAPYVIASLFSNHPIHRAKGSMSAETSIQSTSPVPDKQEQKLSYPENQNAHRRRATGLTRVAFPFSNGTLLQKWLHLFFSNKSACRQSLSLCW